MTKRREEKVKLQKTWHQALVVAIGSGGSKWQTLRGERKRRDEDFCGWDWKRQIDETMSERNGEGG